MYVMTSHQTEFRQVDARRELPGGRVTIWVRTRDAITLSFDLEEVPWLATALSRALEEAKAAPAHATGVLFEIVRGRAEVESAEG